MATMNMTTMQPNGGPVGGGIMMMNTGSPAMQNMMNSGGPSTPDHTKTNLNTYVYEYILKLGLHDVARALAKEDKFEIKKLDKNSPDRRKDGDMNGGDHDGMEMDMKDDVPSDLPRPAVALASPESYGFLYEWFCVFSDLFLAHRGGKSLTNGMNNPAMQYLLTHQQTQRMQESQRNQNLMRPGGGPQAQLAALQRRVQQGGMMSNGDPKNRLTPQQLQMMQNPKANMQNQQAQREHAVDGDPNNRPGTPADGDNGGSPSKRARLEGQPFNAGMMQGRPGVPNVSQPGLMIQAGFNPNMRAAQFQQNNGMAPKMPATMANGMMNMANNGSPMMQGMNQFPENMAPDMYNAQRMPGQVMQGPPNGQSGNHALQDYQMQLMLLEQQNKKRLMMARQEQHDNGNPREGGPMPAGVNMPPGMSPSGSRTGTSPNPTEQMKRTPGMGGMPGSPSAGEMQGRSPANMAGYMNGMQPQDLGQTMFMKDGQMMGVPGGPGMRPPTSAVDMNNMSRQQLAGRMAGQFGPGSQPMVNQASQGQPQSVGTPGQRNEMLPPSTSNSAQRNNQPTSPSGSNAPPTPSLSSKANPKSKKGEDKASRKRPQKKNSTANTASTEDNAGAAPASSAPITPGHGTSFNGANGKSGAAGNQPMNQQQQTNQAMPPGQQQMPATDLSQNFGEFPEQSTFNLDFSTLENTDVLENFDFDSFLNTSADDAFPFGDGSAIGEGFGMDNTGE